MGYKILFLGVAITLHIFLIIFQDKQLKVRLHETDFNINNFKVVEIQ